MSRPMNNHTASNGYRTPSNPMQQQVPGSATGSSTRLNTPQMAPRPRSPSSNRGQASSNSVPAQQSRAERFDDEKKRIIESCFSKLENGQLTESYITHIRIQEDAAYPSMPPPPESPPENKKPRLIIIAVRSTGRVRMHKARENGNGTFSIGKTWNMEELSAIESYVNCPTPPQTERDAQNRLWAGAVGFTVTITKPYYWQAGTSKEKDFFVASAVKIYRKYTKGQVPELRGFDEMQKAAILGAAPGGPPQPPPAAAQGSRAPSINSRSPQPTPPQPPFAVREQSRDESRYRSPGPPGSGPTSRRPSESPARFNTMQSAMGPGPGPRSPAPNEAALRMKSQESLPQSLQSQAQYRPGTSPGPGQRVPIGPAEPMPTPRSPGRQQVDPGMSPPLGRDQTPQMLAMPTSPKRQRDMRLPAEGVFLDLQQGPPPMSNGPSAGNGAPQFQAVRDRYMDQQQQPPPPSQQQYQSLEGPPQLPPLETATSRTGTMLTSADGVPHTGTSESSAGIDLGDAATISALTSYWGPEPTPAAAARPAPINDSVSPPTPERSRRRPQASRNASQSTLDLRPAPLIQARRAAEERPFTPPNQEAQVQAIQRPAPHVEPLAEQPPEIKPLNIQNKTETPPHKQESMAPSSNNHATVVSQPSPVSSLTTTPAEERTDEDLMAEEQFRPGLGPMYKKKAIADRFKKAATAANAFKPRPGGAAEKILRQKAEREGEPDGITGVVPRPAPKQEVKAPVTAAPMEDLAVKEMQREAPPAVAVIPMTPATEAPPPIEHNRSVQLNDNVTHLQPPSQHQQMDGEADDDNAPERIEERQIRHSQVKIKRRSIQNEKYLAALEIDRSLLEGRGIDFEVMLSDFGWNHNILQPHQLAHLERDVRRELGRVEAGSWLSHADAAREERVHHVESLLDKAIEECDELEGLLTLYSVELSSLNDDIAFIEAQSQGLQVQSANQKLLHSELQALVDTMSLDRRTMEPLQYSDLSDPAALDQVENSLVKLYQAILTMDPSMRSNASTRPGSRGAYGDSETSNMVALQEKKLVYDREVTKFSSRLVECLDTKFTVSFNAAKPRVLRVPPRGGFARLDEHVFTEARSGLWAYSPLILFLKELNQPSWAKAMQIYNARAKPLYSESFRENMSNWKRAARPPTGDEADILFTATEKEEAATSGGGITSTARRITVKRSQTLAKTFRGTAGDKHGGSIEHRQPGANIRSAAFAGAMDEMIPLMSKEQNFIVDLFHATSLEISDFTDAVRMSAPTLRRGTNLTEHKALDPDRAMANHVTSTMNEIFSSIASEVASMLDWAISDDPIQGVGVLANLSKHAFYLQNGGQEFLLQLVENLFARLQTRFAKFVEEQIRAIEDTKVKIKKRKGVISFMKIFPHFSTAVENIFLTVATRDYDGPHDCVMDVRKLVDEAYERINRAMFDSLKVIAKESPVAYGGPTPQTTQQSRGGATDDPEDKEMLNYHVLIIENMNHYVEEVHDGEKEGSVLAQWKGRALMERAEALEGYVGRVIRRPLGRILEFLDSLDSLLSTLPPNTSRTTYLSARPNYNRKAMRSLLSLHDAKEIRRGIDTLRKRIEKHFGHEGSGPEEEAISRSLVALVCKECERAYEKTLDRLERVAREVYPNVEGEKEVVVDFGRGDITAGFRR